ncbi:MAG TPA: hypothetical protein VFM18_05100 [Methanosarcina sp.]|nr:hypothetical protein [Methanosarcina sp.]
MTLDLKYYVGWTAINSAGQSGVIERNQNLESEYEYIHKFSDGSYNTLTLDGRFHANGLYSRFDIGQIKKSDSIICNHYEMPSTDELCDDEGNGYAYLEPGETHITYGEVAKPGSVIIASSITISEFKLIDEAIRIYTENT